MTIIPASIRTWLARRKQPAPPKCTDENIAALMGRSISHENNSPHNAEWHEEKLHTFALRPDDIARRGEGE